MARKGVPWWQGYQVPGNQTLGAHPATVVDAHGGETPRGKLQAAFAPDKYSDFLGHERTTATKRRRVGSGEVFRPSTMTTRRGADSRGAGSMAGAGGGAGAPASAALGAGPMSPREAPGPPPEFDSDAPSGSSAGETARRSTRTAVPGPGTAVSSGADSGAGAASEREGGGRSVGAARGGARAGAGAGAGGSSGAGGCRRPAGSGWSTVLSPKRPREGDGGGAGAGGGGTGGGPASPDTRAFVARSACGFRKTNEDRFVSYSCLGVKPPHSFFAVFDGHGGCRAAEYCTKHLYRNIIRDASWPEQPIDALKSAVLKTDVDFRATVRASKDPRQVLDGTTAICALVMGAHMFVTNVGDSRGVLIRVGSGGGSVVPLSTDHKPSVMAEAIRIRKIGGTVVDGRVSGILSMSRSIGDEKLAHLVCAKPDIRPFELKHPDDLVVLATDGLWDVMKNEDVRQFTTTDLSTLAERLIAEAVLRGSKDNVTVMIVHVGKASGGVVKAVPKVPLSILMPPPGAAVPSALTPSSISPLGPPLARDSSWRGRPLPVVTLEPFRDDRSTDTDSVRSPTTPGSHLPSPAAIAGTTGFGATAAGNAGFLAGSFGATGTPGVAANPFGATLTTTAAGAASSSSSNPFGPMSAGTVAPSGLGARPSSGSSVGASFSFGGVATPSSNPFGATVTAAAGSANPFAQPSSAGSGGHGKARNPFANASSANPFSAPSPMSLASSATGSPLAHTPVEDGPQLRATLSTVSIFDNVRLKNSPASSTGSGRKRVRPEDGEGDGGGSGADAGGGAGAGAGSSSASGGKPAAATTLEELRRLAPPVQPVRRKPPRRKKRRLLTVSVSNSRTGSPLGSVQPRLGSLSVVSSDSGSPAKLPHPLKRAASAPTLPLTVSGATSPSGRGGGGGSGCGAAGAGVGAGAGAGEGPRRSSVPALQVRTGARPRMSLLASSHAASATNLRQIGRAAIRGAGATSDGTTHPQGPPSGLTLGLRVSFGASTATSDDAVSPPRSTKSDVSMVGFTTSPLKPGEAATQTPKCPLPPGPLPVVAAAGSAGAQPGALSLEASAPTTSSVVAAAVRATTTSASKCQ